MPAATSPAPTSCAAVGAATLPDRRSRTPAVSVPSALSLGRSAGFGYVPTMGAVARVRRGRCGFHCLDRTIAYVQARIASRSSDSRCNGARCHPRIQRQVSATPETLRSRWSCSRRGDRGGVLCSWLDSQRSRTTSKQSQPRSPDWVSRRRRQVLPPTLRGPLSPQRRQSRTRRPGQATSTRPASTRGAP